MKGKIAKIAFNILKDVAPDLIQVGYRYYKNNYSNSQKLKKETIENKNKKV